MNAEMIQKTIFELLKMKEEMNDYYNYVPLDTHIDTLDAAITACEQLHLTELKNEMSGKWIPVSERLPEVHLDKCGNALSNHVILWIDNDDYEWFDIGFYNPKLETFDVFSEEGYYETICSIHKVNAWMPLPEPYKAERTEG